MTLWDEFYENMMIVYSYLLHIVVSDESCVDVIILLKTQGVSARSAPGLSSESPLSSREWPYYASTGETTTGLDFKRRKHTRAT